MGFLDRLLGREQPDDRRRGRGSAPRSEDEIAVERYRYLLRTAPPETIEQVHLEAFQQLTPEQRAMLFRQLSSDAAEGDAPVDDRPESLARSATRSEMRSPGTLERTLGPRGADAGAANGMGTAGILGVSLLGTVAGVVVGSAIASAFIPDAVGHDAAGVDGGGGVDAGAGDAGSADVAFGDPGGGDLRAGDYGSGGYGSGDFGSGDYGGGGDFGGGDFGGGSF